VNGQASPLRGGGGDPRVQVARAVALFVAAGVAEIGGGYLVWRVCARTDRGGWDCSVPSCSSGGAAIISLGVSIIFFAPRSH